MTSLRNDAEWMVVQALCDRLTDAWLVLPAIGLSSDERDYEIDVVIAHARDGIAVIEVQGNRPTVRGGLWMAGERGWIRNRWPRPATTPTPYGGDPELTRVRVAPITRMPRSARHGRWSGVRVAPSCPILR